MSLPSQIPEPVRSASILSPVLFSLGDPDLLVEVLSSNPAGVVLVEAGPDLAVVYCNESFERWVPLGRQPIVGRRLPELFTRADRARIRAIYREAIRTGVPVHARSAPYHEDADSDQVAYWNASHYPLHGAAGRVTHVLSFTQDITNRAEVKVRVRGAQERVLTALGGVARHLDSDLQTFFDQLSATIAELVSAARVAFWLYDPVTRTISPRPGAFGFSEAELDSLHGLSCRPDGEGEIDRVVFGDLVLRGQPAGSLEAPPEGAAEALGGRDSICIPWKAGVHRLGALGVYGSTRPTAFTDEDVWVLQAAATAAALVWEHRQADQTLAELREREAASLRQQIDQSIQLEQLKTDFLKLASHELRAPLGIVSGYISMIQDGTLGAVGKQVAAVLPLLRAKLEEMNQLINEMLETARLEDSALQLKVSHLDLRDVVQNAVGALEPLLDERHRLTSSTSAHPVVVQGDRARLGMIVTNLVHNAIKYSPRGGEVTVRCLADASSAQVSVIDQGVGISAEDLPVLFTRFGRIVTPETEEIPGTGLGLYLAQDLARRHGGDIEVESEAGRGSTFTLRLPLAAGV
jgi:PAS domain S-box-containing protein